MQYFIRSSTLVKLSRAERHLSQDPPEPPEAGHNY
jgi:hypothetical protein